MNPPFRIKICGVTSVADALAAVEAGADAIGLNFYAGSSRHVSLATAAEIATAARGNIHLVGLFVNADVVLVRRVASELSLDVVQLHGDESPEYVQACGELAVVKAFRVSAAEREQATSYVAQCQRLKAPLAGVVVDALAAGSYGGTGQMADWNVARELVQQLAPTPVILAGGLTPENVAAAIAAVQPAGVDTASGVESSPGHKDPELTRRFVAAARAALLP
jgi:phosphoribosylanthranilate isomerase